MVRCLSTPFCRGHPLRRRGAGLEVSPALPGGCSSLCVPSCLGDGGGGGGGACPIGSAPPPPRGGLPYSFPHAPPPPPTHTPQGLGRAPPHCTALHRPCSGGLRGGGGALRTAPAVKPQGNAVHMDMPCPRRWGTPWGCGALGVHVPHHLWWSVPPPLNSAVLGMALCLRGIAGAGVGGTSRGSSARAQGDHCPALTQYKSLPSAVGCPPLSPPPRSPPSPPSSGPLPPNPLAEGALLKRRTPGSTPSASMPPPPWLSRGLARTALGGGGGCRVHRPDSAQFSGLQDWIPSCQSPWGCSYPPPQSGPPATQSRLSCTNNACHNTKQALCI